MLNFLNQTCPIFWKRLTRYIRINQCRHFIIALEKSSWEKMKNLEVLEFLDAARADGRITNAGFSLHGDKDTFKEIVDAYDWEFGQIQYNFLDQQNQSGTEGLKFAAAVCPARPGWTFLPVLKFLTICTCSVNQNPPSYHT